MKKKRIRKMSTPMCDSESNLDTLPSFWNKPGLDSVVLKRSLSPEREKEREKKKKQVWGWGGEPIDQVSPK